MTPTSFSTSEVSTITMASQGQPSRNAPSGPLLVHFLQPIQRIGSTWIRPNGGWSSSGTQNMQSSIGQYSTQAGEPAQPVQHSVITANSFGFFLRGVSIPLDLGSHLSSSGTIPTALISAGMAEIIAFGNWHLAFSQKRSCGIQQHPKGAKCQVLNANCWCSFITYPVAASSAILAHQFKSQTKKRAEGAAFYGRKKRQ